MHTKQPSENLLFPDYRETIEVIGQQLDTRKGTFTRRLVLLLWPVWVFLTFFYALAWFSGIGSFEDALQAPPDFWVAYAFPLLLLGLWFLFTFLYVVVISFLFDLEKRIWIDSYFDGRNLEAASSWRIASRLFWPGARFAIRNFLRFYLPPILIFLLGIAIPWYALAFSHFPSPELSFFAFPLGCLLAALYSYKLRLRLRYLNFLFLDEFTPQAFDYAEFLSKMQALNQIDSTEAMKKILVSDVSAAGVHIIVGEFSRILNSRLGRFGGAGQFMGSLARITASTVAAETTIFARYIVSYMLYRYARSKAFSEPRKINEYIYSLQER